MDAAEVDVVITWVDGSDGAHQLKRAQWQSGASAPMSTNAVDPNRWSNNDEIYYCLASLQHHAPWIRKIWLVTDQQEPDYSRISPWVRDRLSIIDHTIIFQGFESSLPTFSSITIETALWRIPGLSEYFIYFNDDTFLAQPTLPRHFFTTDGLPILRGRFMDMERQKSIKMAHKHKINAAQFVGLSHRRYFNTAHIAVPLRRSTIEALFELNPTLFEQNIAHRFRHESQLSLVGLHDKFAVKQGAYKRKQKQDWLVFPSDAHSGLSSDQILSMVHRLYDPDVRLSCINNLREIEKIVPDLREHLARIVGERRDAYWYYRVARRQALGIPRSLSSVWSVPLARTREPALPQFVSSRDAPPPANQAPSAKDSQASRHKRDSILNRYDAVDLVRSQIVTQRNSDVLRSLSSAAHRRQIRVAFIVNQAAKWNAESLWKELQRDDLFEARIYVSLVPFALDMPVDRRVEQYRRETDFYRQIDPELVQLYDEDTDTEIPVEDVDADIVFLQQPWGMKDYPRRLLGRALCCYLHYGFKLMDNAEMHFNVASFHSYLWAYFEQTELHRRIQLNADPSAAQRVVVTGYPKLDAYRDSESDRVSWPAEWTGRRKVIYAPHHSLGEKSLRMSTFRELGRDVLAMAEANPDVCWLYKPHPMLHFEAVRRNIMTDAEYREYVRDWQALPNAMVYDQGSYFGLFKGSDALITDSGSFLAEYLPTQQPILWLKNHARIGFNSVGKALADGFYHVTNSDDLRRTFDAVVLRGQDPLMEKRQERAALVYSSTVGSAASVVVGHIRTSLQEQVKQVT